MKPIRKATWKVHAVAECLQCGKTFENYHNAQALAARHAAHYGHVVRGEVGLAFKYDGRGAKEVNDG